MFESNEENNENEETKSVRKLSQLFEPRKFLNELNSSTISSNNSCSSKEDIAVFACKTYEPEVEKSEPFINVNNLAKMFENIEENNKNKETTLVKKMSMLFEPKRSRFAKYSETVNLKKGKSELNLNTLKSENLPKDSNSYKTESLEEIQRSKSHVNLYEPDEDLNEEIEEVVQKPITRENLIEESNFVQEPPQKICPKTETNSIIQNSRTEENLIPKTVTPQAFRKTSVPSHPRSKFERDMLEEIQRLKKENPELSCEETKTKYLAVTNTSKTATNTSFEPPQSSEPKLSSKPLNDFTSFPPPPPEFIQPTPQKVTVSSQTSLPFMEEFVAGKHIPENQISSQPSYSTPAKNLVPPPQFLMDKSKPQNQISLQTSNSVPATNFIQIPPQNLSENEIPPHISYNSEVNQTEDDFMFPPPPPPLTPPSPPAAPLHLAPPIPLAPPLPQANGKVESMHKNLVTPNLTKNDSKNIPSHQVFAVKNVKTQKVDHVVVKNVGTADCQNLDKNHSIAKKVAYGQLRGMYGEYHEKANEYVANMPKNRVKESHGVQDIIETIAAQGGLEKLSGRTIPKKEEE